MKVHYIDNDIGLHYDKELRRITCDQITLEIDAQKCSGARKDKDLNRGVLPVR